MLGRSASEIAVEQERTFEEIKIDYCANEQLRRSDKGSQNDIVRQLSKAICGMRLRLVSC